MTDNVLSVWKDGWEGIIATRVARNVPTCSLIEVRRASFRFRWMPLLFSGLLSSVGAPGGFLDGFPRDALVPSQTVLDSDPMYSGSDGMVDRREYSDLFGPEHPPAWQRFLYWLAGARWELLSQCPAAEQERVAVQGSTVLVPTVMAFLGMYFFAKSRFNDPPFLPVFAVSVLWAFVIMMTDRILIAMYRPFLPVWRRVVQVLFRLGLASVVSVAISFPFCLDQYRPAIRFRYQTELQGRLNEMRNEEASGRKVLRDDLLRMRDTAESDRRKLEAEHLKLREGLESQIPGLEKGQINPQIYADERMEEERRRVTAVDFVAPASGGTLNIVARMDALKEASERLGKQIEEEQGMHRRLVEAIAREELGLPNEFYPEPKRPGEGPRLKDMRARDVRVQTEIRKFESALAAATADLAQAEDALARGRLTDRNAYLDSLNTRREAFVKEAEDRERARKDRLAQLRRQLEQEEVDHTANVRKFEEHRRALEDDHARAQQRHDDTYLPPIQRVESKINGLFDPMEETIGLYKVIFTPPPDMPEDAKMEHRWMAGLFQFLVIFGTLFLLDIVPIAAKLLSRPGAYDILVEHSEFIANANWADFSRHFSETGNGWPGEPLRRGELSPADASLLLKPHYRRPQPRPEPSPDSSTASPGGGSGNDAQEDVPLSHGSVAISATSEGTRDGAVRQAEPV